jgi:2-polyprenyl-3-methyl-5-hydroxy-6-metoxy-1,4-benzoquinol methylase
MSKHAAEIASGDRFEFGANWESFLSSLNDERIAGAEKALQCMLQLGTLSGRTFLDIGSGSGLSSLAAHRLGAEVVSFDYDPRSVGCTRELKRRYFSNGPCWTIEEGSILDEAYIKTLGKFDIVYSWGVLHHTGQMQAALANATIAVDEHGLLCLAVYNDQGMQSRLWKWIKRVYCAGFVRRFAILTVFIPLFALGSIVAGIVKYGHPLGQIRASRSARGMSLYHDWVDWLGGYPFEVAKPEDILRLYRGLGFTLVNMTTTNGVGCNEFVFQKL